MRDDTRDERIGILEQQVLELAATVERLERRTPAAEAVDVDTAARLLSISRVTIYDLIKRGSLASVTIGRARRIPMVEVRRFVAERRETAGGRPVTSPAVLFTPPAVPVAPKGRRGRLGPHRRRESSAGGA